uniref:Uncharacterized protein n=1 Tax=Anguilla anguilla TaxID=7936 RepID=A0A0E9UK99_ANGAN
MFNSSRGRKYPRSAVQIGSSDGGTHSFLAAHQRKESCLCDLQKKMCSLYPFV